MFKISKAFTPIHTNEMFHLRPLNNTIQSLRSPIAINIVVPMPHKELSKHSIIYSGPLIWNNVPENLRQVEIIDIFHKLLNNFKMIHMMNSVCVWGGGVC